MAAQTEVLQVERFVSQATRLHEKTVKLPTLGRFLKSSLEKEIGRIETDLAASLDDEAVQLWITARLGLLPDDPQEVEIDPKVLTPEEVTALTWYRKRIEAEEAENQTDNRLNGDKKGKPRGSKSQRNHNTVDRPDRKRPFRSRADFIQAQERLLELVQGELEVNPYQMFNTALFAESLARDEYHILRLYRILAKKGQDLPPKINDLDAIDQRVSELTRLGVTDEGILDRTGISESRLEASRARINQRVKEKNKSNILILRKLGMTPSEIRYVLGLSRSIVSHALSCIYEKDGKLRIRKKSLQKSST